MNYSGSSLVGWAALIVACFVGFYAVTHSGTPGQTGPQGLRGQQGIAGQDGKDGSRGPQGIAGSQGTNGSNASPILGAAGNDFNSLVAFYGGFVLNDNYATTTPANATLSGRETAGFSTVSFFPNVGSVTLTTAASTTLGALLGPTPGAMKRVCYYNATTTAGIAITFVAGTGVDMEVASSTATTGTGNVGSLTILADASGCIEYQKKSSSDSTAANRNDILARFTRYVNGD